jgi:hypothetical protein
MSAKSKGSNKVGSRTKPKDTGSSSNNDDNDENVTVMAPSPTTPTPKVRQRAAKRGRLVGGSGNGVVGDNTTTSTRVADSTPSSLSRLTSSSSQPSAPLPPSPVVLSQRLSSKSIVRSPTSPSGAVVPAKRVGFAVGVKTHDGEGDETEDSNKKNNNDMDSKSDHDDDDQLTQKRGLKRKASTKETHKNDNKSKTKQARTGTHTGNGKSRDNNNNNGNDIHDNGNDVVESPTNSLRNGPSSSSSSSVEGVAPGDAEHTTTTSQPNNGNGITKQRGKAPKRASSKSNVTRSNDLTFTPSSSLSSQPIVLDVSDSEDDISTKTKKKGSIKKTISVDDNNDSKRAAVVDDNVPSTSATTMDDDHIKKDTNQPSKRASGRQPRALKPPSPATAAPVATPKQKKGSNKPKVVDSDEEEDSDPSSAVGTPLLDNLNCTMCNELEPEFEMTAHPLLGVPVCFKCRDHFNGVTDWERDDDGFDKW